MSPGTLILPPNSLSTTPSELGNQAPHCNQSSWWLLLDSPGLWLGLGAVNPYPLVIYYSKETVSQDVTGPDTFCCIFSYSGGHTGQLSDTHSETS